MEETLSKIESELLRIKERNVRVEAEKAWERSATRIGAIMLITYTVACIALFAIANDHPFRNALIPALGFFLSTQSIPFLKTSWLRSYTARR